MKIGLIGTGGFSRMHAGLLKQIEGVQIASICGSSSAKAENMAAGCKGAAAFGNVKKMLEAVKLDAVYICVPPMAHGDIEKELIQWDIPFFVEKPLGNDYELPRQLAAMIEEKSLITSVGYQFRYMQSVYQLKKLLKDHKVGLVTGNWGGSMPQVHWWRDQTQSGGQFIEQTTHLVDLLRYLLGEIREVHAVYGEQIIKEKYEGVTVADIGTVSMKMENGIVANLTNTCILPEGVGNIELVFYTDQGIIKWSPKQLKIITAGEEKTHYYDDSGYLEQSKTFLQAVQTGNRAGILAGYADAAKTQKATCAALESSRNGLSVVL
ncbi:Gfo/Idh/MocA family protein [Sediminibacillus albus]|nr:Gfo/Idh/MocA family oxidoreductase [Sediminibacillus albus]